jgi:hypothetical protein
MRVRIADSGVDMPVKKVIGTLGAAALGAAAMYVLDPNNGKERRAKIADKAKDFAHKEGEMLAQAGRDLKERVGAVAQRRRDEGRPLTKPVLPGLAVAAATIGARMLAKRMRKHRTVNELPY